MINYEYIIISIILLIIIIAYYFLTKNPNKTPLKSVQQYIKNNNSVPLAFTWGRREKDKSYINYEFDIFEGNLIVNYDKFPVKTDGTTFNPLPHGEKKDLPSGIRIQGVNVDILCPDGWNWDVDKRTCVPPPVCNDDDDGYIKGLNMYQFQQIETVQNLNELYHSRLYAICGPNKSYTLGSCTVSRIYNQKAKQPANVNPCVFYDICSENPNNFKHREQIDDHILKPNEYYICQSGKSILSECTEPLVFSIAYDTCVEQTKCVNRPDNSTIYVDDEKYIVCMSEKDYTIVCPNGVFTGNGDDHLTCINNAEESYVSYFTNKWFSYPYSANVVVDNEVKLNTCDGTIGVINYPIRPSPIDIKIKTDLFDEPLTFRTSAIEYVDGTYTSTKCIPLSTSNIDAFKPYTYNPNIMSSYAYYLPSFEWNLFRDTINTTDKYANIDGKIRNTDTLAFVVNQSERYPITTSNQLYKPTTFYDKLVQRTICPAYGYIFCDYRQFDYRFPYYPRLPLFCLMMFKYGKIYRMMVSNRTTVSSPANTITAQKFYVIDVDPILVDESKITLYTPNTSRQCYYAPPISKIFNVPVPSRDDISQLDTASAQLYYYTMPIDMYGTFTEEIVRPHWLACLKIERPTDITGHVARYDLGVDDWTSKPLLAAFEACNYGSIPETTNFPATLDVELKALLATDLSTFVQPAEN